MAASALPGTASCCRAAPVRVVLAAMKSMQERIADLRARREAAYHAGSERAVERQHAKGKMTAFVSYHWTEAQPIAAP